MAGPGGTSDREHSRGPAQHQAGGIALEDHGPLWAEARPDVYQSWLHSREPVPLGQIHGYSTIVSYRRETWLCGERIRQRSTVDWTARHTVTRISGCLFIGIDPKHGTTGAPTWSPLILHDAVLLT